MQFAGKPVVAFFLYIHFGIKGNDFGKISKSVEMERMRYVSQLLEKA
jgi:hypothetical protein